jgi:Uma2 family endonuclease
VSGSPLSRSIPTVPRQPDVFVVPIEQARTLTWSRMQTLLLVAEVLSPSSVKGDRFRKRLLWRPVVAAEPFTLPLEELFRPL